MFSNDEYIKALGKAPRGTGMWAFSTHRMPEPDKVKWFYGSLTEAKRQAKAAFEKGATIYVLP